MFFATKQSLGRRGDGALAMTNYSYDKTSRMVNRAALRAGTIDATTERTSTNANQMP
jgi:hypothetical protein